MQTSFPPLLTSRVKKTLGAQKAGEDTALLKQGFHSRRTRHCGWFFLKDTKMTSVHFTCVGCTVFGLLFFCLRWERNRLTLRYYTRPRAWKNTKDAVNPHGFVFLMVKLFPREYSLEMESYRKMGKLEESNEKEKGKRRSSKNRKNFLLNGTDEKWFWFPWQMGDRIIQFW